MKLDGKNITCVYKWFFYDIVQFLSKL